MRQEHGAFVAYNGEISPTPFRLGRFRAGWQLMSAKLTSDENALCEFFHLIIRETGEGMCDCKLKPQTLLLKNAPRSGD
jgi:hypothetical protein